MEYEIMSYTPRHQLSETQLRREITVFRIRNFIDDLLLIKGIYLFRGSIHKIRQMLDLDLSA